MANLFDPVTVLRGIGKSRARQLSNLGIETLYDLISYFPRSYEDRTKLMTIDHLAPDVPACFEAMVISVPRTSHIRKGLDLTKLTVADASGRLNLTFFNQSYVAEQLQYGESYVFYGKIDGGLIGTQMANPLFEPVGKSGVVTRRIVPIYTLTSGITNRLLVKIVAQALDECRGSLPEILPEALREQFGLCGAVFAYEAIHQPPDLEALACARRRLVFEEFFIFSAGLSLLREKRMQRTHISYALIDIAPFLSVLPFSLTDAQQSAIDEILGDFTSGQSMNRLVQGDVGSGKTMIAAAAVFCCVQNGFQAVLMAPTEILADQHYQHLKPLFDRLHITTALLTGSLSPARKRELKASIAAGQVQVIIGTHALLTKDVSFHALDLVIVDEQHRFGVAQRVALSAKGGTPHLLVMSATPIPRTLALILYGDLDISVVDELPPGRQPIDTFLVGESMRSRINAFIRKQTAEGHQVYIVCPAVEEQEESSLKSVDTWTQALQQTVFPDLTVDFIHGRMNGSEKEAAMARFSSGVSQILVATTVIEVGVDVPNATLIVIENAERFGLSQLHQLRGRVGRGDAKSYCVLFSDNQNAETRTRLKAFCSTGDGFKIAEEDLRLRGPGDFFGHRQHGLPVFKVANLSCDLDTLKDAQDAAKAFLSQNNLANDAVWEPLCRRIQALFHSDDMILN